MVLLARRSRGWRVRHSLHFALQDPGDREAGGGARAPKAAAKRLPLRRGPAQAVAALPCRALSSSWLVTVPFSGFFLRTARTNSANGRARDQGETSNTFAGQLTSQIGWRAVHPARRTSVSDELQRGSFRQARPAMRAWPIRPVLYQFPMIRLDRVLDPLAGRYGEKLHAQWKLRAADACSELGVNLVEPKVLVAKISPPSMRPCRTALSLQMDCLWRMPFAKSSVSLGIRRMQGY